MSANLQNQQPTPWFLKRIRRTLGASLTLFIQMNPKNRKEIDPNKHYILICLRTSKRH